MLQLRTESVLLNLELDEELEEFLTAPITVQKMSPELWLGIWDRVCTENSEWLEKRDGRPYCLLCAQACIFSDHLNTKTCKDARAKGNVSVSPLLHEILLAADR